MLDTITKRRIDTARDILVGKLPDPKSQVEQITIALIYKFMDDMDKESEELGGKKTFFAGEYEKYSWTKIFDPRLGGYEIMNLYTEAITRMNHNKNVPQLFRDIFKNAYLPYRDPETLKSFLKIINEFTYDHSEKLGDAFEYLLSIMGSQGDAGQFRTPRHIIDFMVEIVDPKKNETVLDPACGTAGFLISSYKHIIRENTKDGKTSLTPDDRKKLIENFTGYDISPDMVRMSLVNLYLHGFQNPRIYEYDTLTSEERWNEKYDVILANPPFMTPKGGIRPHKRFSIQANRSEVLFTDYIAEHLNPNGRAGIIVPEGIIFQSSNAYKALRKMLVENYLYAVVSLPGGVFNPYSGVKTSILLLDKNLAKKTESILFVKITDDGFGLGAQRKASNKTDLPPAIELIKRYRKDVAEVRKTEYNEQEKQISLIVPKAKIQETSDYYLTGDRYKEAIISNQKWPMVELGSICKLNGGGTPSRAESSYWNNGTIKWISAKHITTDNRIESYELITKNAVDGSSANIAPPNSIIFVTRVSVGKLAIADDNYAINQDLTSIEITDKNVNGKYVFYLLRHYSKIIAESAQGLGVKGVTRDYMSKFKIPLPPLSVQQEIVDVIQGYQKIVDGARQVVDNYKPEIKNDSSWELVELGDICLINPDKSDVKKLKKDADVSFVPMSDLSQDDMYFTAKENKKLCEAITGYTCFREDDVLLAKITPCFENGKSGIAKNLINNVGFGSTEFIVLRPSDKVLSEWIYYFISDRFFLESGKNNMTGSAGQQRLTKDFVKHYKIPLPPIEIQTRIVSELESERKIVEANKKLADLFEKKIRDKIAELWS